MTAAPTASPKGGRLRALARRLVRGDRPSPLGGWLYRRPVVEWVRVPELRRQLPAAYRPFSLYCRAYFTILPRAAYLRFGRSVLSLCIGLHRRFSRAEPVPFVFEGFTVFLDVLDPRFLHAINEVQRRTDTQLLDSYLRPGDTFVDIGANQGSFSLVASTLVGEQGMVVSVEPQPRLAAAIERTLSTNRFSRYQVHQMAVGDQDGQIELLVPHGTSGRAGVFQAHSGPDRFERIPVPLRRFADAVDWENFPGRTFMKVDTEGSEMRFLAGARIMLERLRPSIILEINPGALQASGVRTTDIAALLESVGYREFLELDALEQPRALSELQPETSRNVLIIGNGESADDGSSVGAPIAGG